MHISVKKEVYPRSLYLIVFLFSVYFTYLLARPLFSILVIGFIFTFVFSPLCNILKRKIKYENIAILLTITIIILITFVPSILIIYRLSMETSGIIGIVRGFVNEGQFMLFDCEEGVSPLCSHLKNAESFVGNIISVYGFDKLMNDAVVKFASFVTRLVGSIADITFKIFLGLFVSFFLFKDGEVLFRKIMSSLPLQQRDINELTEKLKQTTNSVVFAYLMVAIIQGVLAGIGYFIFGMDSPLLLAILTTFSSLIPFVGTPFVWVPASLYLIITGIIADSYTVIGRGAGLFLYGLFVVSTSDNIVKIKIISDGARVHPIAVLIGVIGGVSLFGFNGVFIGPILFSVLTTFLKNFKQDYLNSLSGP